MRRDGGEQLARFPLARKAERPADQLLRHCTVRCGRGALVKQAQSVAQRAVGKPRQKLNRLRLQLNALLIGHIVQPRGNILLRQPPERKPLAARKNRRGHLVQLGRGQNEQQMLGRLLDDFQKCVERRGGEHVHLVDDVHTHAHLAWRIDCVVAQHAHAVHTVV